MSPVVIRVGSLSIEIRSREHHNRPHAHATYPSPVNPEAEASVALDNFEVLASHGFDGPALNTIVQLVIQRREELRKKWKEIHG